MSQAFPLLACLFLATPPEFALDTISQERAEEMDGQLVTASLLIAKPEYFLNGRTIVGGPDHFDGIERGFVLKGKRTDLKEGERITVKGRLRVIDHPPTQIGVTFFPGWREIVVVEGN